MTLKINVLLSLDLHTQWHNIYIAEELHFQNHKNKLVVY